MLQWRKVFCEGKLKLNILLRSLYALYRSFKKQIKKNPRGNVINRKFIVFDVEHGIHFTCETCFFLKLYTVHVQ